MITLIRLQASNFKSLRSVTLVFPEQGAMLIEGHNEAGKSTLFEAVYVALYGKPLVGEDKQARQEEVIQFGQSHAFVELTFNVNQQEMTVSRHFERGKSQQAKLVIVRPGAQPEEISRVRAVDERILKELGNLDGDSLRNSCFVEQKELGRIEDLSLEQRKQAIQKLLGLEKLTQLIEQFKFRREQERELVMAQGLLRLAKLQDEVRTASAREAELAERLDAVKVAGQLSRLAMLEKQEQDFHKLLAACKARAQEASDRLALCSQLKDHVSQCDRIDHQITAIAHTRAELQRIAGELKRLDAIERIELPQARAYLNDVRAAADAADQVLEARKRAQAAEEACREAERSIKVLEQAEADLRQKENDCTFAQNRVVQRRAETEKEQRDFLERLSQLKAREGYLEDALASVKQWEDASKTLQALQQEISAAEERQQRFLELESEIRQQEEIVRNLEHAITVAEKEMRQANEAVRLAAANEALTTWMRLKEVELALGGYVPQQAELSARRQEAEKSLATARAKTRIPLMAGAILTALTIVTIVLGFLWHPAFVLAVISFVGAIFAWLRYSRTRKDVQRHSATWSHLTQELQQLDMRRQAAIQVGGDPATLHQYEQQIRASGLAIPSNLEAAHDLQNTLRQQLDNMQEQRTLQVTAQAARDKHIRLAEQLKLVRSSIDEKRKGLYPFQQSGNLVEQLTQLRARAAAQEKVEASCEEIARKSLAGVAQWPVDSNTIQAWLSACQAELRTTAEEQKQRELASARLIQEAEVDKQKAEDALRQARELVAAKKTLDPASQLSRAREMLAGVKAICHQQEEALLPLLNMIHLHDESEVEPERGRTEAKIQALENALKARPQYQEDYKTYWASLTNYLAATSTSIKNLLATLNRLPVSGLPSLPSLPEEDDSSFPYEERFGTTIHATRKALQATLEELDEQGTSEKLKAAHKEQGQLEQQLDGVEGQMRESRQMIDVIIASRGITAPGTYTYDRMVACWPLLAMVSPDEQRQATELLNVARQRLYAAQQQESLLAEELQHPNTPLSIEECQQKVTELLEEREICRLATQLLKEAHDRIARRVLPVTERNMAPLLEQLTVRRYRDVRLTPEDKDGQQEAMDYRIRVWDPAAGRYIAKNLFSGGTRDQCSLALRLAFALATLPQELGVAPGFIFLDEPLSAFDAARAQALVQLVTTGTIAQQFNQVILISHQHAFDREAFQYHVKMDSGQIIESDLPASAMAAVDSEVLQPANAMSD